MDLYAPGVSIAMASHLSDTVSILSADAVAPMAHLSNDRSINLAMEHLTQPLMLLESSQSSV